MSNHSDEIALGILKGVWVIGIVGLIGSFVTHHPVFIGVSVVFLLVISYINYSYCFINEHLGSITDLLLCLGSAILGGYLFFIGDGPNANESFGFVFVLLGWISFAIAFGFFNAWRARG